MNKSGLCAVSVGKGPPCVRLTVAVTKANFFVKGRGWFLIAVQEEKELLD